MKETIVTNQYYELAADSQKNRLYYTIKGFWPNAAAVPNNYDDFIRTLMRLTSGFDCVADVHDMKTPPEDVAQLHMSTQKLCVEKGISRTAEVFDQAMINLVMERYSRESKLNIKAFGSVLEAEVWLDSLKK
jgi:hypothetical protein